MCLFSKHGSGYLRTQSHDIIFQVPKLYLRHFASFPHHSSATFEPGFFRVKWHDEGLSSFFANRCIRTTSDLCKKKTRYRSMAVARDKLFLREWQSCKVARGPRGGTCRFGWTTRKIALWSCCTLLVNRDSTLTLLSYLARKSPWISIAARPSKISRRVAKVDRTGLKSGLKRVEEVEAEGGCLPSSYIVRPSAVETSTPRPSIFVYFFTPVFVRRCLDRGELYHRWRAN